MAHENPATGSANRMGNVLRNNSWSEQPESGEEDENTSLNTNSRLKPR